jgi:hypothetical protein
MMGKIFFSVLLASVIWSACSKSEIPDGGSGNPVFWLRLNAEGADTAFYTAGLNNIYLYSEVNRDTDEVVVMSGTFADVNCPNSTCPGSARFDFRNISTEPTVSEPNFLFGPDYNWIYKSPSTNAPFLGTVAIRWVTPSGNIYKSELSQDSTSGSTFEVLESEPWELNERGETTWKMLINFSCQALDSMQNQVRYLSGNGVIAVGYR